MGELSTKGDALSMDCNVFGLLLLAPCSYLNHVHKNDLKKLELK